jgi:hypothetical protein
MRVLKALGNFIKNFMIIFSFIVNLVLLIVVVVLALTIFDIKNNIATPLVAGLHSSFVGLDEATIDWTIPVRDKIPVVLNIPLNTDTVVTLTQPVPLTVQAVINLPGVGTLNNAQVNLQLPQGLQLPVHLELNVPVDQELDVALDVRAVIPLQDTQLHDPINNLRLLFEPLTRGLYNLPGSFEEAGPFAQRILDGNLPNLLDENDYSRDPWPGFSQTAGVGYQLGNEPVPAANEPIQTGIVQLGGIPALDEQLRPDVYQQGGPQTMNEQASEALVQQGIARPYFDGTYFANVFSQFAARSAEHVTDAGLQSSAVVEQVDTGQGQYDVQANASSAGQADGEQGDDMGILPTQPPTG